MHTHVRTSLLAEISCRAKKKSLSRSRETERERYRERARERTDSSARLHIRFIFIYLFMLWCCVVHLLSSFSGIVSLSLFPFLSFSIGVRACVSVYFWFVLCVWVFGVVSILIYTGCVAIHRFFFLLSFLLCSIITIIICFVICCRVACVTWSFVSHFAHTNTDANTATHTHTLSISLNMNSIQSKLRDNCVLWLEWERESVREWTNEADEAYMCTRTARTIPDSLCEWTETCL